MKAKHEMMPKGEAEERYMMDKRKARKISISVYILFMVIAVAAVIFFFLSGSWRRKQLSNQKGKFCSCLKNSP